MLRNIGFYAYILKSRAKAFFTKEDGAVDIVAVVILSAIAIGVGLLFKDEIAGLIQNIIGKANQSVDPLPNKPQPVN